MARSDRSNRRYMRKKTCGPGYIEQDEYIREVSVAQLYDAHSHGQYTRHTIRFNNILFTIDYLQGSQD